MTSRYHLAGTTALGAALLLVGCQSSNPNAPARVSGRVTYNGNTVPGGSVIFHYKSGGTMAAAIRPDGSYEAFDIPTGEASVSVDTESVNPEKPTEEYRGSQGSGMAAKYNPGANKMMPKGKGMKSSTPPEAAGSGNSYVKIPKKYWDPASSGLTITVEKGNQTKNFELSD